MGIGEIITWPFAWLLLTFYNIFKNYGIAIILFSVVIKLILLPFQMKSKRSTMRMSRLAPLMKDLEKKYGDDKQKYQMAVSKLYKDEGISPMSGCIWNLIPLPIIFLLYGIIRQPLTTMMRIGADGLEQVKNVITGLGMEIPTGAYAEMQMADIVSKNFSAFEGIDKLVSLDFNFLGLNLGAVPNWQFWTWELNWATIGLFLLPVISAALSYVSMKISMKSNPAQAAQQSSMKGMNLMMPLMSLVIGYTLPAALCVYWIINSLTATIQDVILNKHYGKIIDAEDAERRERIRAQEEELEKKRLETERKKALGETERNKSTSKKKLQAAEKARHEERLAEERAAQRAARGLTTEIPESQVGTRRYARGRAYVSDRFTNPEDAEEATKNAAAMSEFDDEVEREFEEREAEQNAEENAEELDDTAAAEE